MCPDCRSLYRQGGILEFDRRDAPPEEGARRRHIAVAGNMGSGKSSLVEFLSSRYEVDPFFEPNEQNPYLEDFYKDMKRWSFESQMYFLAAKFKMQLELEHHPRGVIQDRTIWEDAEIFAENLYRQKLMSKRDYRTYRLFYESIEEKLRAPSLLVYLRCPVKAVRKRIAGRGRAMEKEIPIGYLRRLHNLYERWIEGYRASPVVVINTDKMDYLTDLLDCHDILKVIDRHMD